jgi:prepilin-type N-terminal cleavage/methylation domain-containing protein/prepilin-type processing-associated H-X9-DG protein
MKIKFMNERNYIMSTRQRNGFTLIELLVVISIIAVLMAIMMPALRRVKMQAEKLICNTHLKDIGNLVSVYAADNNGKMVSSSRYTRRWWDLLAQYYGGKEVTSGVSGSRYDIEIFKCPVEAKRNRKMIEGGITGADEENIAARSMYGYNGFFMCRIEDGGTPYDTSDDYASKRWDHIWYSKLAKIKSPSSLSLFWDSSSDDSYRSSGPSKQTFDGDPHMSLYKHGWDSGNNRSTRDTTGGPAAIHEDDINALFADGHAQSNGLWIYKDTLADPELPVYYLKYFHPTRAKEPTKTVGDGWPPSMRTTN